MDTTLILRKELEIKRNELEILLETKETECAELRTKRNALTVAIGLLVSPSVAHPIPGSPSPDPKHLGD